MFGLSARTLVVSLTFATSLLWSSTGVAQCQGSCAVGALGQGGVSSDGAAQGFRYVGPGLLPEYTVTNVGNFDAGHVRALLDGEDVGVLNGTYRDDVCIGMATGIFGDYQGVEPDC